MGFNHHDDNDYKNFLNSPHSSKLIDKFYEVASPLRITSFRDSGTVDDNVITIFICHGCGHGVDERNSHLVERSGYQTLLELRYISKSS